MGLVNRTGAELICLALKNSGVDLVYGIPGVHNLALFEALRRARIRVVVPCHEQGAVFMATGQSQAVGRPGVLITVPGPGLTNALTGIAEAYLDSVPLVVIVSNIRFDLPYRHQLHQIDQVALAEPVCKAVLRVRRPDDVTAHIAQAFHLATASGEPGPVVVDVASEVLWQKGQPNPRQTREQTAPFDEAAINNTIERVISSERVGLFTGQGALDARNAVQELAEWLGAPVMTTHSGRGVMREDHPQVMDFLWRSDGVQEANAIMTECDLVLALGVKFSEHGTRGYSLKLPHHVIHVDRDANATADTVPSAQHLCMDTGAFLRALLTAKDRFGPRTTQNDLTQRRLTAAREKTQKTDENTICIAGGEAVSAGDFFATLRELLPDDAVLVTDSGHHQILACANFPVYEPHTLLVPADYQAMGYAIPVATGVGLARPDREVVAVVGDGSFVMSGLELLTAAREQARLKVLLFKNGGYGILRDIQLEQFGVATSVDLKNPDFASMTASLGAAICDATGSPRDVLQALLRMPGVALLEVEVRQMGRRHTGTLRRRMKADLRQLVQDVIGQ